ncbi:hypothetical protein PybrP1_004078 [[Pythium] brassicae (nom. inval.)]|nr:hypothetical protein PybrP1_004078 [[Pythium] brassicae (nom. inval.)]
MQDAAHRPRGYRQAHATRLQPSRAARKPPPSASAKAPKTLFDAVRQHGARLCDGTKLNAVGRGIERVGVVPAAVSAPVSALFLSQNRLTTLEGVEQFAALRVLSAAGNALASFEDVARLAALPRLRALNLLGNPLCDQPHYRLRVVDCLATVQVLDTTDVSARERELAPRVAAQERALRSMVVANHFAIQTLQRVAQLVQLRRDLAGFVLGYVAAGRHGRLAFDRVPSPHDATVDVAVLMRVWDLEQTLSRDERSALERQLLTIVIRTRNKLAEHPKLRAKTYLLQLASTTLAAADRSATSSEARQQCASWDDAYGNVITLQQQTIASLRGLCDRHNQELVAHLKTLLTTEPSRRRELVHAAWGRESPRHGAGANRAGGEVSDCGRRHSVSSLGRTKALPPQQQDPDQSEGNDNNEPAHQRHRHQHATSKAVLPPAKQPAATAALFAVSKFRQAPMSLEDVSESHELAANMNHRTLTSSSVSGFSDASSFWRGRDTDGNEEEKAVGLQPSTSSATAVAAAVAVVDNRLCELEDREAKYIKALIESEQRELDLRNQLTGYRQKIAQYRQAMAQTFAEREQIKHEVVEKVQAVAAPRVLRRSFVRWVRHYHWALQVAQFRRRRAFIAQHDWFWRWRRRAWTLQNARGLRVQQQRRALQRHFTEWTNLSRLAVIVAHAQRHRGRRFARRVFHAWRAGAKTLAMRRLVEQRRALTATRVLQHCCFRQWAKRSRHRRQLTRAIALQSRQASRALHECVFWRWRALVVLHARPLRVRVEQLLEATRRQCCRQALQAWRNVVRGNRLHVRHLQRRTWTHWRRCSLSAKTDREAALRSRRAVLKAHIQSWHSVAQELMASRRSLGLAKRYVNQRRLRKLWRYWKRYTFAKRKYVQGSTKALKHYFIKLLRGSWQRWRRQTRQNLMSVKETKRSELRRHFESLRAARAWGHWIVRCLERLREKIGATGQRVEGALAEKHEMEADLLIANDRSVSLSERAASLEATIREQERELAAYQHELARCDGQAQKLQAQVSEEQARAAEMKRQLESAELERQCALDRARSEHAAEMARLDAATSELATRFVALEAELQSEQRQKEEIATRLLEYDSQLATARDDMRQHDEAQLRENERLRLERDRHDALAAAERVRSAELQQLLAEKNEEIHSLTQSLQQSRERERERPEAVRKERTLRTKFRNSSAVGAVGTDCSIDAGTADTTLHSLLKDINESIRARTECGDRSAKRCDELYTTEDSSRAPSPTHYAVFNSLAADTDAHIDEHTSKIHDDIRHLQERIAKRLQQPPAAATAETRQSRSIIAEEWVNVHLETSGTFLLPATDLQPLLHGASAALGGSRDDALAEEDDAAYAFRTRGDSGPLGRAGIDRASLYRLGMPKDLVDRLYRALYVYTNGFHNLIAEIAAHCPPHVERHVSSNVWLTFLLLLEQCENGKYEMAMLKFKQATQEWRRQMQEEFVTETTRLEAQLQVVKSSLSDEALRSTEKSGMIAQLAAEAASAHQTISSQHAEIVTQAEQLRLLRLELLVHEDDARTLNAQLDDTRKDCEVANAERTNALAERFALEEELRKLQLELDRVEAEKASYAKRTHEGLFMHQALRAAHETLKQHAVVLALDKEKAGGERDALQAQLIALQDELQELKLRKVEGERELVDSERRLEHVAARAQTVKHQLELEVAANSEHVQALARLRADVDEERVRAGVLEAKCSLLTAEKQNTGMRAQDKLRIERLLNQKLELENAVEALKLERAKGQEQLWDLRASLEALDAEMQHSKRVFSAGQQAFLHSERTCEQLRGQLQEAEKSYDKASKNLSSLRERFKLFEESSKDQLTKLEVELKITTAQLREVSYANRDNAALIAELKRSLEAAAKESKSAKGRLEAAEQSLGQLRSEKEELQRDHTRRELQRSSSKSAVETFVRALQHILALVKLDAYPFDEALRELLRLTHETFGAELALDRVLADEDEAEEFEEELDDDDVLEAQRTRRALLLQLGAGDSDDGDGGDPAAPGSGERRLTQLTSMSKFRKSKLDKQVKQLQRDTENKSDMIRSLESTLCEQADELARVTRTSEQQHKRLELQANRVGMLLADVDTTATALAGVHVAMQRAELAKRQAETDRDAEIERALEMQLALERTRRQSDMDGAASEDLLSKLWRAYEHQLLMLSLRRDAAVQATVPTASQEAQTLVPHRNPATERARVSAMLLPAADPLAATLEDVIQQINSHAKALLPDVAGDLSLLPLAPHSKSNAENRSDGLESAVPVVHPAHRVGGGGRIRNATNLRYNRKRYDRTCEKQPRHAEQQLLMGLPLLERQQPQQQAYPPHIIRHVNEFGVHQDVLISPVYPPYFNDGTAHQTPHSAATHSKAPRKPEHRHRRYRPQQQQDSQTGQGDERCGSPVQAAHKGDSRRRSPRSGRQQPLRFASPPVESSPRDSGDTGLRYHRGFLRTGMEVLRNAGVFPEDDDDEDGDDSMSDSDADPRRSMGGFGFSLSPPSPGRLEDAIRRYQKGLDEQQSGSQRQRRREGHAKDEEVRGAAFARDDGFSVDADVLKELSNSPFVPAVLYPLLPPHR